MSRGIHDHAGNERFGLVVPMRVLGVAAVDDEGVGEGRRVLGEIETIGMQAAEGIESRARLAGNLEGIEDMDRLARCPPLRQSIQCPGLVRNNNWGDYYSGRKPWANR